MTSTRATPAETAAAATTPPPSPKTTTAGQVPGQPRRQQLRLQLPRPQARTSTRATPVETAAAATTRAARGTSPTTTRVTSPTVKQVNVNAPVSILSVDSNNGDVRQSNDAARPRRGRTPGTEQKNVNVPVSILRLRCEQRRRAPVQRHRLVVEARLRLQPAGLRLRRRLVRRRLVRRRRQRQPVVGTDRWAPGRRIAPRRKLGRRFACSACSHARLVSSVMKQ